MPLAIGNVTVSAVGVVTKSHASGRLYDKLVATYQSTNGTIPNGAAGADIKRVFAEMAAPIAEWMVEEITTYAAAHFDDVDQFVAEGGTDIDIPIV
jgi:hypothetical protein